MEPGLVRFELPRSLRGLREALDATSGARVFRGGNFNESVQFILPAFEGFNGPTFRSSGVGFRCARVP